MHKHDGQAFCRIFFRWYNQEHRHSGINRLTPESLYGEAESVLEHSERVLKQAYERHPGRFKRKIPMSGKKPDFFWINPPTHDPRKMELPEQKNRDVLAQGSQQAAKPRVSEK